MLVFCDGFLPDPGAVCPLSAPLCVSPLQTEIPRLLSGGFGHVALAVVGDGEAEKENSRPILQASGSVLAKLDLPRASAPARRAWWDSGPNQRFPSLDSDISAPLGPPT